jgi:hypothetical protein
LDWNKSLEELAVSVGCCPETIYEKGIALGKQLKRPFKTPVKQDWLKSVDWNKKDIVIAKEVGLSRERIRQVRLSLKLPSSITIPRTERYFKVNLQNADWSKNNAQIAEEQKLSTSAVDVQRKIWAPETKKKVGLGDYFKEIDWTLKQKKIQQILKEKYGIITCQTNISRYKRLYAPDLVVAKPRRYKY